jgi:pimeloyl-ACP methyl ester carboxylesterase
VTRGLGRTGKIAYHTPEQSGEPQVSPSFGGPISRSYISQRLRLHYADWGNEGAPPLVLVHGGRDHCRNWDWVASRLRADWHVIAPDLRGHGDSQWADAGGYGIDGFIYDLAQLIHQQNLAPVTIVAHSLGGNIALRYAGCFPEQVRQLVAIEGLGPSPAMEAAQAEKTIDARLRGWIGATRKLAGRLPRRYASIEDAYARMKEENSHLSAEQALHLTRHGVRQNEDGTYSWKFDNYIRAWPPYDMTRDEIRELWGRISCPTLLIYGSESWASNPAEDGRAKYFSNARVALVQGAGHWVHHDRLEVFMELLGGFLSP